MIIRTSDRDINVIAVYDDIKKEGKHTFPALRFEIKGSVSEEELACLTSGNFQIVNDLGEVLGTHEGYKTLEKVSVTISKISTAEERVIQLESSLQTAEAEISANQKEISAKKAEIEALEVENAELLFFSLTNKDFNSLTEEDIMIEEPVVEEVIEPTEEPTEEPVVEPTEE